MKFVAIVPAAGSGSRMQSECPKQYLSLLGQPLMAHTLRALCDTVQLDKVYVVISEADEWFDSFVWPESRKLAVLRCGGASRAETVNNALEQLSSAFAAEDWVLVHDAARPCIRPDQVSKMIAHLRDDPVGGLLAIPVADTVKRADADGRVAATVPREALWRAQTPQMFRLGMLSRALSGVAGALITDESSAIEALGLAPRLIEGSEENLKVTYPADLIRAESILNLWVNR